MVLSVLVLTLRLRDVEISGLVARKVVVLMSNWFLAGQDGLK